MNVSDKVDLSTFLWPVLEGDMQVEFWRAVPPMTHNLLPSFVHWHPIWQVGNGWR